MLADGGNAIDAAFAANFVLGVVTPYMCGFGGDLLTMVWDGELHAYRGVGRAPAGATADVRARRSRAQTEMPVFGPHPVTVPGAVEAWFTLLEKFATRSFGELVAARVALRGGRLPGHEAGRVVLREQRDPVRPLRALRLPRRVRRRATPATGSANPSSRARSARSPTDGPDAYYRGPIGAAIAERLQAAGGCMTAADVAAHAGAWVEPLRAPFRDVEILEMPPPTQGVTALEALRIVDGLDLGADGPDREHLLIEAVKLALADRHAYLGDPDAMTIAPERLLARRLDRAPARRASIRSALASPRAHPEPDGGTIYMCAADRDGMLVSLIQSNFSGAGSGLRVQEWGINLHNRGSAFVLDDAHPNGIGPRQDAVAHADPRDVVARRPPVAGVRHRGRARSGADAHPADGPHARRRRRSAARDQRAALHDRSRRPGGSRSRTTSTRRGSTISAAAATRSTSCRATATAPASRTRSSARLRATAAAPIPAPRAAPSGL